MGKKDTTKMKKTNMLFVIKKYPFLVFWKNVGCTSKNDRCPQAVPRRLDNKDRPTFHPTYG